MLPSHSLSISLALTLSLLISAAAHAGGKDAKLDPDGKPKQFDKGDVTGYAVWRTPAGWRLRTTSADKHAFLGRVYVVGGTFEQVESFKKEKSGKLADHWKLNPKRDMISFEFKTDQGVDGIDLVLSKDAIAIRFDLYVDGKEMVKHIWIGGEGQHPRANPFSFRAHPEKKEKKKGK